MIYNYEPKTISETNEYSLVSFHNCNITILGNVDNKDFIKENLGKYIKFNGCRKSRLLQKDDLNLTILIEPKKPMLIKQIYYDGGIDSKMYNSSYIAKIEGLKGQFWKNIVGNEEYSKIKIYIKSSCRKLVPTIMKKIDIIFKEPIDK